MELTYQDFNAITPAIERAMYERVLYELVHRSSNAFFKDSFAPSYLGPTAVVVNSGFGLFTDSSAVSPEPKKVPLYLASNLTVNLQAPDATFPRIDLICVKPGRVTELSATRKFKDAVSGSISNQTFAIQEDDNAAVIAVAGTPATVPAAPSVPAGYIAIAQCAIAAVGGMAGSGSIIDLRTLMPIGPLLALNTLGFGRLTAGSAVSLTQLMGDIDTLLKRGYFNYFDIDEINTGTTEPAAPGASKRRVYFRDGIMYVKDSSGTRTPLGSGSGGGGGANWYGAPATAPIEDTEFGEKVWFFDAASAGIANQKLELWVRVPSTFITGRQISVYVGCYSPSSTGTILLSAQASLVRKATDSMGSTAFQRTTTNVALTNTLANQYREVVLDVTDQTGQVAGTLVNPGDLLKIELYRNVDSDVADIRFVPSATEIKF